jgi:hypothetical protein
MDALVLSKRMNNLLHETMDLSQQLAQALDRGDQVTIQMLMSMRAEPVEKLKTTDRALRELRDAVADPAERQHLTALLKGQEPEGEKERALASQAEANARQLQRVLDLDRRLNKQLAREKSVYQ